MKNDPNEERIEYFLRNVFHITHKDNLKEIKEFGLMPSIESKVAFFDDLKLADWWFYNMHKDSNPEDYVLLSFDLRGRRYYIKDKTYSDFYTYETIPAECLSVLKIFIGNKEVPISRFNESTDMKWTPLKNYKLEDENRLKKKFRFFR